MDKKKANHNNEKKRDNLRKEYKKDTGNKIISNRDKEYEDAMDQLREIGVPFSPDGTPLGIGWDD